MQSDLSYIRTELRARRAPGRSRRVGDRLRYRSEELVNRMALTPTPAGREEILMRNAAHLITTSKRIS